MRLRLIVVLLLVGCREDIHHFGNTTPPAGQILVFDNRNEPATLDPAIASGSSDGNIIMTLFEGLVQRDPLTTRPMAALATHYEVSADGMSYKFYLRGHPPRPDLRGFQ